MQGTGDILASGEINFVVDFCFAVVEMSMLSDNLINSDYASNNYEHVY